MDVGELPPLLTAAEVAKLYRIKPKTLYERHRLGRGVQPVEQRARRLLWRRDEVLTDLGLLEVAG